MFEALTQKLRSIREKLSTEKELTESAISEATKTIRLALLDADVSYPVASAFIKRVKEKAIGIEKMKGVTAEQQFTEIVHKELANLMGAHETELNLQNSPTKIVLMGLQGSGKTTTAAKLARLFSQEKKKKVLLVAMDLKRPAAIEQLKVLGKSIDVDVFTFDTKDPCIVAKEALKKEGYDVMIFDTEGRLAIDEQLMQELREAKEKIAPHYTIFVANSHLGQDAVNTAKQFHEKIGIDGSILTMLDGSSRAGAALSICQVSSKPLLFEGVGEHVGDLQVFHPQSMADRILGMGDVINFVKKAKASIDEKEKDELEQKFIKASFTFDDYLKQMSMMKKMGPLKSLMKMLPGDMTSMIDPDAAIANFSQTEAIIRSMTRDERLGLVELEPSRRRRIAKGSGTTIEDVNKLVKGFKRLKQFSKQMPKFKKKMKGYKNMDDIKKMFHS